MRRLIVNADDFGLTSGVNRAVAELHAHGILTSATLMANARATEEAIGQAMQAPSLGVGCHVVLVDGEPTLPPDRLPTLTDRTTGRFHPTLGAFLGRLLSGRIRPVEIEAEAAAQIQAIRHRGVLLTHVDTHKHTHMFPAVLRPLLKAAKASGIERVRNPFEPSWATHATAGAPLTRRMEVRALRCMEPAFRRIVAHHAMATTDGAIGVLATGTLDAATLQSLLKDLPDGTWELVTHPGYNDFDLQHERTRLTASRNIEREALLSIGSTAGNAIEDIELISFAQLTAYGAHFS